MTKPCVPEWAAERLGGSAQGRFYLDRGRVVPVRRHRRGRFGEGRCHSNASWLANRWPSRYEWWTGRAGAALTQHSWVRSLADGEHVEVTWREPGTLYIGLPMPRPFPCLCGERHPTDCAALRGLGRCGMGLGINPPRPESVREGVR